MNIHDNFVANGIRRKPTLYPRFQILIKLPYVAMFSANRGLHKYINASLYFEWKVLS